MSVIVYKNAQLLLNGAEITGAMHELMVNTTAELLDATVFGSTSRHKQGGLTNDSLAGKVFLDNVTGAEGFLFDAAIPNGSLTLTRQNPLYTGDVGGAGGSVQDPTLTLCVVFPDTVIPGGPLVGTGYVLKGTLDKFIIGGAVGTLTDIQFEIMNSGTDS